MKAKRGGRRVVRLRTTFIDADASCPWLGSAWSPIPDQLSDEITDLSNRAASVAVVKFPSLIKQLALPKGVGIAERLFRAKLPRSDPCFYRKQHLAELSSAEQRSRRAQLGGRNEGNRDDRNKDQSRGPGNSDRPRRAL